METREAKTRERNILRSFPASAARAVPQDLHSGTLVVIAAAAVAAAVATRCAGVFANSLHHREKERRIALYNSVCIGNEKRGFGECILSKSRVLNRPQLRE